MYHLFLLTRSQALLAIRQPDHSTIPVISSSEVCTDSESDDGEDLATARGLQEYKRWRTRRPKKTTQSLMRKPYGNDGTTRNLRHDYCTMPGQRIIQDEKLVSDTLLKSCVASALGSRAAQNDYLKLLARDFKKLSDHDERLQPHLSLPNSPPIEVCQEDFCLVYVASSEINLADQFITIIWNRVEKDVQRSIRTMVHENPDYPFHNLHLPETPEKKKSAMEARDLHDKMVDIDHAWYIMDKAFCERHPDKKSCIAVDQTTLEQGIPSHHPPKKLFDRKSWLLLLLLFKKVFLTFLPVGHTGNEVDSSVFGSVKDKCKVSDIVCLFDIFKVGKEGLTKPNQLIYLRSVIDFRSFFQSHLLGIQRTMEGRYFEFQLSDSRRSDSSRFPVVRGKKYLNELAEFGEWIPFMDGNPQGMPKPAPPTLDILPDNVKKTLKKLLRHPLLIKGEDRREWIENFLSTGGKDDGVRVIGEHEAGMIGRPGQLKIGALTVDIRVVEASSLPPLNLIEAADQRITVADEAYKSMLAADDGGRLHMKLIPSSTKTFKNIRTNDQSENQSADPECLPVSATVRESQLEKVVEGMHASMLALASKQEALQQEFESREHEFERKLTEQKKILEARVSEEEQKRRVLAHKYHQLKEAFSQSENSTPASKSTPADSHPAPTAIATSNLPNEGPITAKRKVISRPDLRQDKIPFLIPVGMEHLEQGHGGSYLPLEMDISAWAVNWGVELGKGPGGVDINVLSCQNFAAMYVCCAPEAETDENSPAEVGEWGRVKDSKYNDCEEQPSSKKIFVGDNPDLQWRFPVLCLSQPPLARLLRPLTQPLGPLTTSRHVGFPSHLLTAIAADMGKWPQAMGAVTVLTVPTSTLLLRALPSLGLEDS
eukprot:g13507.t1